ncbi:MAG TPA: radical SAM family heme chaperone HemW [Acidisarcina sp.]
MPFCRSKCSFCNFASGVFPESSFAPYIGRVIEDVRLIRPRIRALGMEIAHGADSVYLGGGTPSILPPSLLRALLAELRNAFEVAPDAEITVECAPGQLADEVLAALVEAGVNRISFGVQTFVDREAAVAGRLHSRATALCDIERVRRAGISAINVDLIAGLPLQTASSWRETLDTLASTEVSHASVYMFEVDEDSRLGDEVLRGGQRYHASAVPDDDRMADLYSEAIDSLADCGLVQYEISNFARPGAQSVHNKKYWLRQPYLGFGVDAHSMLRGPAGDLRFAQTDDLERFLRADPPAEPGWLTQDEIAEESWFLGLRLNEGVDAAKLDPRYRYRSDQVVEEAASDGLLERAGDRVRLTARGRLLSNEVFQRFLIPPCFSPANPSDLIAVL